MNWGIERSEQGFHITDDSDFSDVALVYKREHAVLLSAAPDLLEALKLAKIGIEAHIEYARGKEDYTLFTASVLSLQTIDEAIKKASGE